MECRPPRRGAIAAAVVGLLATTAQGGFPDCNNNGSDDALDIANGISTDGDNNGVPDECQVRIDQLNYQDSNDVFLPAGEFSHYGQMTLTYLPPPPGDFLWGQVVVDGEWVVRNMPLVDVNLDGQPMPLTTQFDLGNLPGQPVPSVDVQAQITPDQLDHLGPPPLSPPVPLPVDQVIISHGGRNLSPTDGDFAPDLTIPPDNFQVELNFFIWEFIGRPNMPNMNVKMNHCSPGAAANSLQCLKDRLCLPLFQTQQQIFDKMRNGAHMNTGKVTATLPGRIYSGNKRFVAGKGLGGRLKVKGIGNHYPDGAFNPATVHQWMDEGKDVQLDYGYIPRGGHSVVVAGSIKCGNQYYVIVRSDHNQHRPAWQNPGDAGARPGGVGQWDLHCVTMNGAGQWMLTNEAANNDLGAVALCPMAPPVIDYVFSPATVDWSPGTWTKFGFPLADTFVGGVTTGPTQQEAFDILPLPLWPNDWHWDAIFEWNAQPRQVVCWFENFLPEAQLGLELYCTPFLPQYMIQIDVGNDIYIMTDPKGFEFHQGQFSQYPFDLPKDFQPTGYFRNTFNPNAPQGACCLGGNVCMDNISDLQCAAMDGLPLPGQTCVGSGCFCPWDCAPPGGNGTINFDDLVAVVNAISTQDLACDVAPDNGDGSFGNGVINFDDILAVINNFGDCPPLFKE